MHQPPLPLRLLLLFLLVALAWTAWQQRALFSGGPRPDPHLLRLSGTVEVTRLTLAARVGGRLLTQSVAEGTQVEAGAILATLDNPTLAAQGPYLNALRAQAVATYADLANGARPEEIAQARAALSASRERLHLLEAGSRSQEHDLAATEADLAREVHQQAFREAERARHLFGEGVMARQSWEASELTLTTAAERLKLAESRLSLVEAGARDEELGIATAQVRQQQAAVELLVAGPTPETLKRAQEMIEAATAQAAAWQADMHELTLTAPRAGIVDRYLVDAGEVVAPGQTIVSVRDLSDVRVRAWLPEPALGQVRLGQKVQVLTPNMPPLEAAILTIASTAEFTPRNIQTPQERATQVFALDLRFTDPPDWLRDGMTLDVEIERLTP